MATFTDEELMAFADGALDEPRFTEIAVALETDPALAERLEQLVVGGSAAKALYGPLADTPVPPELRDSVEAAIAASTVVPFRRSAPRWMPMAIAAAVATLLVGPIAYLAGRGTGTAPLIAVGQPVAPVLAAELGRLPSGAEVRLADATIRPIASFTDAASKLCREFELDAALTTVAVACREADQWRVAIAIDAPPAGDGYAPASSLAALDAFLQSIEAGPPLSPTAEVEALTGR